MVTSVLLVGCGHMGSALARGWIKSNDIALSVLSPSNVDDDIAFACKNQYSTPDQISSQYDIIVLAIKPQILNDVCASISQLIPTSSLVISIAAGKDLQTLGNSFHSQQPIIRSMPNLPASIQEGVSVCIANNHCSSAHNELCTMLMSATGTVEWVENEEQMDAVTALSGSGPAYLFHLVESMNAAATSLGLSNDLAERLARQTIIGSASMLKFSEKSATTLREDVTSKGGTTEAAMDILMKDNHLKSLITKAMTSSEARSKSLN